MSYEVNSVPYEIVSQHVHNAFDSHTVYGIVHHDLSICN